MEPHAAFVRRAVSVAGAVALFVTFFVAGRAGAQAPAAPPASSDSAFLVHRDSAGGEVASAADPRPDSHADSHADSVAMVARLLVANGAPERRAGPVARAVLKYAGLRGLDPLLVVGVIGVENAELVSRARSRVGATGIMQVMPHWKRDIRDCGGSDLREVAVNVCFATRVLRIALDESASVREALLRYNGCVRAPGCHRYASAVFSQTGRAVILSRVALAAPRAPGTKVAARGS